MRRSIVSTDGVELLKWLGAAAMLVEHVAHFVYGDRSGWPIIIGRAAFPLFALALAVGVNGKTIADEIGVARRLALWGVATFFLVALVKEPLPLNVLFTLALGLAWDTLWRAAWRYRYAALVLAFPLMLTVEYGPLGVAAVAALCASVRRQGLRSWLLLTLGAFLIAAVPGNIVSIIWWPIALAAAALLHLEVPRIKRAFYWIYAGQWPILAALRALV